MNTAFPILAFTCCWMVIMCSQKDVNKLAEVNTNFAHRLYNQLRTSSTNIIFSPLSMSVALSMMYIGSCETTRQELEDALSFSSHHLNQSEILQMYRDHIMILNAADDGSQFSMTNSLFKQDGIHFHERFTSDIKEYFDSHFSTVNFSDSDVTLDLINGWIRNKTHGKINTLLSDIDPVTVLVLLNAVYFRGEWVNMFDVESTRERSFVNENGVEKPIQMMADDMELKFNTNHPIGASVLELPYKNNTFSMIIVLPYENSSLSDLETRLSSEGLLELSSHLYSGKVKVIIPKMKLESDFSMISHLQDMGIRKLFTDSACLTGISSVPLSVSQVKHKATIEVSEEGCEASASSSVHFYGRSSHHQPMFIANRPFMFLIRHNPTNVITFMGRFADA